MVSASRALEMDHSDLLEEIVRRERIDQEETIVYASDVKDKWSTDGSDVVEDEKE
jgi:hypothetical protein